MPHNVVLSLIGTGLLWVGWFGFNAGSALWANAIATGALAATHFSAAAAGLSWSAMEWITRGKPSVLGAASGMVAGLATITPASGFVTIPAALLSGLLAGIFCFLAVTQLKARLGYDDSLDVFGVYGVGSTLGMLLLGFLASAEANSAIASTFTVGDQVVSLVGRRPSGLESGSSPSLSPPPSAEIVTWILLKLIDSTVGLRVSEEDENAGLDTTQHGESAYKCVSARDAMRCDAMRRRDVATRRRQKEPAKSTALHPVKPGDPNGLVDVIEVPRRPVSCWSSTEAKP